MAKKAVKNVEFVSKGRKVQFKAKVKSKVDKKDDLYFKTYHPKRLPKNPKLEPIRYFPPE
ncbi:MAG: hypothetical protein LBT74_02550 [Acidobacteriota bacterium]|nr:hypothetical protein [Acidobacteriota bacterium]